MKKWISDGKMVHYISEDVLNVLIETADIFRCPDGTVAEVEEFLHNEEENWNNCLIWHGIRYSSVREMIYHLRPRYFKAGFVNRRIKRKNGH